MVPGAVTWGLAVCSCCPCFSAMTGHNLGNDRASDCSPEGGDNSSTSTIDPLLEHEPSLLGFGQGTWNPLSGVEQVSNRSG